MFSCTIIKKRLSAFLDDELSEKSRKKVSVHLNKCRDCEEYFQELRNNNLALGRNFSRIKNSGSIKPGKRYNDISNMIDSIPEPAAEKDMHISWFQALKFVLKEDKKVLDKTGAGHVQEMSFEISSSGEVASHGILKLIPALIIGLGIILFYATNLNAILI